MMSNEEHLKIFEQGIETWNKWRKDNLTVKPDLSELRLSAVCLTERNIHIADLSLADLNGTNLSRANLSMANLSGANLKRADLRESNLSGANLDGAFLIEANIYRANLSKANLDMAMLSRANLSSADLSGANLCRAYLSGVNLEMANLDRANLEMANLDLANLCMANLSGASLSGTYLLETIFGNTNLKNSRGLDKCEHGGPSTIDHRTLQTSGQLPLEFLRGCGLPDNLIDYLPSLLNQPVQYYSCFISYSSKNREFADRLHADLQNNGVRCWLDEHDMKGGQKTYRQIEEAIRIYDRVILVLSEHSMESEWVITEIRKALAKEKAEKRDVLFPIRLIDMSGVKAWECFDSDTGVDLAKKVREYYIPDFSNWKDHDAYIKGFDRLLRDLKQLNKTDRL